MLTTAIEPIGSRTVYNENCATYYFSSLRDNIGLNTDGTCTYIAAAMLLSYYDSYWNDDFIDEVFEEKGYIVYDSLEDENYIWRSPGIKMESNWKNDSTYSNYDDFIEDYADQYFHLHLIKRAQDYHSFYNSDFVNNIFDALNNYRIIDEYTYMTMRWALSMPEVKELVEQYLLDRGIGQDKVTVNCVSYKDIMDNNPSLTSQEADAVIRQMVIDRVNAGIPVLYAGYGLEPNNNKKTGHAMIAYDYDSTQSQLIFHSGLSFPAILVEDDNFIYKEGLYMMWLDINTTQYPHRECYNYLYDSGESTTNKCMCIFSTHPKHNHIGNYHGYNSSGHIIDCTWCGEVSDIHDYKYMMYDNLKHRVVCNCGFEAFYSHVIPSSSLPVKMCLLCGYCIGSSGGGLLLDSVREVIYITENGSYILPDGIVVLSNLDVQLYWNGELDLSELIKNAQNPII